MPEKISWALWWFVGVVLLLLVVWSGVFMLAAMCMSLWAGVFWYGVSLTTFGALFKGWLDWRG